jgi:hypothetical protein
VTLGERLSRVSRRLLRNAFHVAGVASFLGLLLWGIPTAVVWRSPAWASARALAERDGEVRGYVGAPLRAARLPARWRLAGDAGEFRFVVSGPGGALEVEVEVEAGRKRGLRVRRLLY